MPEVIGAHKIIYGVNSRGNVIYLRPRLSDTIYIPEEMHSGNGLRGWVPCAGEYTPKQMNEKIYKRKIRLNSKYEKEYLYVASPREMKQYPNAVFIGIPKKYSNS